MFGRFMVLCGTSECSMRDFLRRLMIGRYDEGTAFMPIVTHKNKLPLPVRERYRFLAPDVDAQDLPPDWYILILAFPPRMDLTLLVGT